MIQLRDEILAQLRKLCEAHQVRRLELFGSAVRGAFDPASSDLDFLVLFQNVGNKADQFLGLLEGLVALFERDVDLVDIQGARNPYFIASALKNRVQLYAA